MSSDYAHDKTDKLLEELEKRLAKEYSQAVKGVQGKLDDHMSKFAKKDKIKREQLKRGTISKKEYNDWRVGQIMIGERWEELRLTLAQDLQNKDKIARSIIDGYLPDVYALNHNYGTYEIEKNGFVDTSYTLYNHEAVEKIMRENPDILPKPGKNMKRKLAEGKAIRWQEGQIQSVTMQAILQGESIPRLSKRIAQTLSVRNMRDSIRYARTAVTGAQNAGRTDSYKRAQSMGIELEQQWIATLDNRTRHSHRVLDGEVQPVGGMFSNGCRFPGDPEGPPEEIWNCRCRLNSVIKGFAIDARDLTLRNTAHFNYTSYEEWENEHRNKNNKK